MGRKLGRIGPDAGNSSRPGTGETTPKSQDKPQTTPPLLAEAVWQKASRSNGNGGNNCIEVAILSNGVAVRDSKNKSGPALMFTQAEWTAYVDSAKDGEFDLS